MLTVVIGQQSHVFILEIKVNMECFFYVDMRNEKLTKSLNYDADGMADGRTELESVSDNLVFLDNELEEL